MAKATIKEVAAEAEVSTATVSRVLNESGFVSEEIKERVMEAVAKLNYQPSAIARSLKQDKTYMIGVIVPDISNSYFMGISRGIEDVVGAEGFQLMFCSSDENPEKEERLLNLLQEKRVDAVVLATAGGNDDTVKSLSDSGLPIVLVDRKLDSEEGTKSLDLVAEDNEEGAARLTEKLLAEGHVRIGVVNGPARVSTGRERFEGVRKAMRDRGIADQPIVFNGGFSTEDGIRAVRKFLQADPRPTAIVSLNNQMSLGVLLEIVRSGLKIPEDMAVASFGEVEAGPLLKNPGLHYIDQHPYDMGIKAGEILLKRIRKEEPEAEPAVEIFRNEVNRIG
ncbi:LacI family DNA-binding transcriptional regulator [Cohnella thailandensis]|uniref:LacI family DNA-binding transcriptional regulator n=1 Tax=Cohnella thailandensis TaxID=557557 RepID=A0A841T497_9BACL|nr:LacI family DNA-binding transcriptional regulator [Cohnella thailandensis]MBB6636900.1 LacI family DNA-binding transcriptional regulator [Cohnella thailandensis]MBP1973221.1 LacI family transcriptional regulator [Cohnella thailandensis]